MPKDTLDNDAWLKELLVSNWYMGTDMDKMREGQATVLKAIQQHVRQAEAKARIDELNQTVSFFDDEGREDKQVLRAFVNNRLAQLQQQLNKGDK